ncbi:glycosyltransferase [Candidatus Omnitrophota bacterium]
MDRGKIAICSAGELFGGVEQWIVTFVKALTIDPHRFAEQNEDVGTGNLEFIVILFWEGKLAERLRLIGIEPFIVNSKGTYDFKIFSRVKKILSENSVELVHTHGFKADFVCGIAAKQLKLPLIKTQHGAIEVQDAFSVTSLRMRMNIILSRIVEPLFDKIIFVTNDLMVKRFVRSKKMSVIHNSIPAITDVEKVPLEPRNAFKIGIVGRLSRVKGHRYLIEALKDLDEIHI